MKRTGEFVLGIIGMIAYAFFSMFGALIVWAHNNKEKIKDMMGDMEEEETESPVKPEEFDEALSEVGKGVGWFIFFFGVVLIILGIVALVFLKGNKRPKPAGIILTVTAALTILSVYFFGTLVLFGAIPYLIAGIMSLVRKPPQPLEE